MQLQRYTSIAQASFAALLLFACVPAGPAVAPEPSSPPAATPARVWLPAEAPPEPQREFRGLWVASVDNMDWPSRKGLSTEEQQAELRAIMDRAVALHLNAIVLQVRPSADALYASELEPWSEYLTGEMGRAPQPFYDPLAFAIEEAHARGLELHAWLNPYRARVGAARTESAAPAHVTRAHPGWVRTYASYQWLDPADPAARRHTLAVIRDITRRYDVDAITIDDYFYPYREYDKRGRLIQFPDDRTWEKYQRSGGELSRADWRRENVNEFVAAAYETIHREKPWVKFGISPFGIWRPGYPEGVYGLDSYAEIFADSRKWIENGWADYFAPQLYWPADAKRQNYLELLRWWIEQNRHGRHVWPANNVSRIGTGTNQWSGGEIVRQVQITRDEPRATGNIHFGMRALLRNRDGVADALLDALYESSALVPASPWLDPHKPRTPEVKLTRSDSAQPVLEIRPPVEPVRQWILRIHDGTSWRVFILPGSLYAFSLPAHTRAIAISGTSRTGVESNTALLPVGS